MLIVKVKLFTFKVNIKKVDFVKSLSISVTDGWFDGTGQLACLSPFSVLYWISSNYLFRTEACYPNVLCPELKSPIKVFHMSKTIIIV